MVCLTNISLCTLLTAPKNKNVYSSKYDKQTNKSVGVRFQGSTENDRDQGHSSRDSMNDTIWWLQLGFCICRIGVSKLSALDSDSKLR